MKKADHLIGFFSFRRIHPAVFSAEFEIQSTYPKGWPLPSKPNPVLIAFEPALDDRKTNVGVNSRSEPSIKRATTRRVVVDGGVVLQSV
jgi:hypothetical protein